ncbi:unnamed protein product, partial [Boreogadus saida]
MEKSQKTKTDQDIKGAKALSSGRLTLRTGVPITGRRLKWQRCSPDTTGPRDEVLKDHFAKGLREGPRAYVAPTITPSHQGSIPPSEWDQLKDALRAELKQEIQSQVSLLGKTIA